MQLDNVYVASTSARSVFTHHLKNRMYIDNINVAQTKKSADYTLYVNFQQRTPQMTSMTGGAEAGLYSVYATATISLVDKKGHVIIVPNTISRNRRFSSNTTQVLSADSRTRELTTDLRQDIIRQIMMQLASVKTATSTTQTTTNTPHTTPTTTQPAEKVSHTTPITTQATTSHEHA
jgi:outer membrane lipopolysaccharide assembly protein LptE/RlpB